MRKARIHKSRMRKRGNIRAIVTRVMTTLLGGVLALYGIVAFLSPLPLGAPLIIVGILMIAVANPAFRPVIVRMRRRWRWFNKLVIKIAPRTSVTVREVIEETDPNNELPQKRHQGKANTSAP